MDAIWLCSNYKLDSMLIANKTKRKEKEGPHAKIFLAQEISNTDTHKMNGVHAIIICFLRFQSNIYKILSHFPETVLFF